MKIYSRTGDGTSLDLWAADIEGETEPRLLRGTDDDDGAARFSPDGQWISFWSTESGLGQVYLARWPEMTPIQQVSTTTGSWSFWTSDGSEMIYKEEAGKLLSVTLTLENGDMRLGAPQPLFDHLGAKLEGPWLDLTADGERFLSVNTLASNPPAFCDVVVNWLEQVRRP